MTDTGHKQEERSLDVLSDNFVHTSHIMIIVILALCVMLIAAVSVILYQHDRFTKALQEEHKKYIDLLEELETTETYEYDIEQEADDNSNNVWVGRDFFYGSDAENACKDHEDPNP